MRKLSNRDDNVRISENSPPAQNTGRASKGQLVYESNRDSRNHTHKQKIQDQPQPQSEAGIKRLERIHPGRAKGSIT